MYLILKRIIDIILSSIAIILLSPILILIIIILKLTGEGEIFYLQERVGYKTKNFMIYKFATMVKNSPNIGTGDVTLRNDPRVTKAGKFLRESKLNELPQLFNIFMGDISVIGPRPLMRAGFNRYSLNFQNSVYNVKPGLTGIGSIVFRDEERILTESELTPHECYKEIILPYKGELEIWYQTNCSLFLDLQLIFMTAWVILVPTSKLYEKWFKELPKRSF
jgi:lipopolysaccharide/colanic/teichoic acid biosynthesis glycosyltransferase|tara:strand:- start:21 stop:683 length:663 start_codon:yes stop_codon:yes gene_type:complete